MQSVIGAPSRRMGMGVMTMVTTTRRRSKRMKPRQSRRILPRLLHQLSPRVYPTKHTMKYVARHSPFRHVTLQFFMRVMGQEGTYWSSRPSEDRNSCETLVFATQHAEDAVISDVAIKPFRELRLDDSHVAFTWPEAVVSVYRLPVASEPTVVGGGSGGGGKTSLWSDGRILDPTTTACTAKGLVSTEEAKSPPQSMANDTAAAATKPASILYHHQPVYVSDPWKADSPNDTGWQHFRLPDGVVGNVIVISLNGKFNRQFAESGYYVCDERVECRGVPLRAEGERTVCVEEGLTRDWKLSSLGSRRAEFPD